MLCEQGMRCDMGPWRAAPGDHRWHCGDRISHWGDAGWAQGDARSSLLIAMGCPCPGGHIWGHRQPHQPQSCRHGQHLPSPASSTDTLPNLSHGTEKAGEALTPSLARRPHARAVLQDTRTHLGMAQLQQGSACGKIPLLSASSLAHTRGLVNALLAALCSAASARPAMLSAPKRAVPAVRALQPRTVPAEAASPAGREGGAGSESFKLVSCRRNG